MTEIESSLKLHIGGIEPKQGWTILDIEARPEVDIISDASCLDIIPDESVAIIYASHVLEHFHYGLENRLMQTLAEWYRVLKPNGQLLISVPDLKTLCWLFINPSFTVLERHHVMRIIFGGQTNLYDVHYVGFDYEILSSYLHEVGFSSVEQVSEFNLFNDCSSLRIFDNLISLNVVATK
jgi:predicted SAM-dependent methyltransferase